MNTTAASALIPINGTPGLSEAQDFLAQPVEQRYDMVSTLFPDWLLTEPIQFPANSDVFVWVCQVPECENSADAMQRAPFMCDSHMAQRLTTGKLSWEEFLTIAWQCDPDRAIRDSRHQSALALASLPESLQREVRYALHRHAKSDNRTAWEVRHLQAMIRKLAELGVNTLHVPEVSTEREKHGSAAEGNLRRRVWRDLPKAARPLSVSPETSRREGWFDPVLVGGKPFITAGETRREPFDLAAISQSWLRELTWDWLLDQALSPKRLSAGHVLTYVRSISLLSHLLRHTRDDDGDHPERMDRSAAQALKAAWDWHVEEGIHMPRAVGDPAPVSESQRAVFALCAAKLLRSRHDQLPETAQGFLNALPIYPTQQVSPSPRPLSEEVWQAVTGSENIALFDQLDSQDVGYADAWLEHAYHGGRMNESLQMRLGCIAMVGEQPFIWRNQSKIGNVQHGMPCHHPTYQRLLVRQEKTRAKLRERYAHDLAQMTPGRRTQLEREWDKTMPLYPRTKSNPDLTSPIPYGTFKPSFATWIKSLHVGDHVTTHRTRHTIATALLNNGAPESVVQELLGWTSNAMIKQYGQFSDEHRIKPMLQIWTAGPGMPTPGRTLLTPDDFPNQSDQAAIQRHVNLSVIPVDHGLCQYGPVVGGAECPFNKNCTTEPQRGPCEHFVLTGADYAYWNRKYEAAVTWAEGAPTEETRDYILNAWDGWNDALDGLRKVLDDLGLLEAAKDLDLRTPHQDYLDDPVWTTAIPFKNLTDHTKTVIDVTDGLETHHSETN